MKRSLCACLPQRVEWEEKTGRGLIPESRSSRRSPGAWPLSPRVHMVLVKGSRLFSGSLLSSHRPVGATTQPLESRAPRGEARAPGLLLVRECQAYAHVLGQGCLEIQAEVSGCLSPRKSFQ